MAVIIGPEGLGVYGLLNSFFTVLMVLGSAWMGSIVTKFVAEYFSKKEYSNVNEVINISLYGSVMFTTILLIISIVFRNYILHIFLANKINALYYIIFSFSCIGFSIRTIYTSILQGMMDIPKVVKYRVVTTLIEIAITLVMVYYFKVLGFIVSFVLSSVAHIVYVILFLNQQKWYSFNIKIKNGLLIKKIKDFGKLNIGLSVLSAASQYYQSMIISLNLNLQFVGFLQASQSIMNYMGILNRGTAYTMLPVMSSDISLSERNVKLNEYFRFTILTNGFIAIVTIIFLKVLIHLLYSSAFLDLTRYVFLFILAQFFISIELIFQSVVLGLALLRTHLIGSILNIFIWVVIPLCTIRYLGFNSISISLIAAAIVTLVYQSISIYLKTGLKVNRSEYTLLIVTIVLIVSVNFIDYDSFFIKLIELLIISVVYLVLTTPAERKVFVNMFYSLTRKFKLKSN